MSRALIIVDVQHDFLPGGALPVAGGDEIIDGIVERANKLGTYDIVVTTLDWHPSTTKHFERWPVHCVKGSDGARLHPEIAALTEDWSEFTFFKGDSDSDDGYSGFEGFNSLGEGLADALRAEGITEVEIVGLALDYCVRATALDAVREGFWTTVVLPLTRAVDPAAIGETVRELKAQAVFVEGERVARWPEHEKLRAVSEQSQTIGEFLDFGLSRIGGGLELFERIKRPCECGWCSDGIGRKSPMHTETEKETIVDGAVQIDDVVPTHRSIKSILAEYFGIDMAKIDAEKEEMLDELRRGNE